MSSDSPFEPPRGWLAKFRNACRGLLASTRGQSSFAAHGVITLLVIICGFAFGLSRIEWCLLLLCIALVAALETINSAIEELAKAVDTDFNPQVGRALDMASGAVLFAALGAATVGLVIFVSRLLAALDWITLS